ncbi:MAG: tetratricopeptide repeat protein, partial [Planctomycetota bacterium]
NPEHTKAQNNLANLIASREPKEAESLLRAALDREPDNAEVLTNLANLLSQHGRVQESFTLWDKALEVGPVVAATLLNRGEARLATGRAREGIVDLEEAVRLEPTFVAARARLAWHLAVSSTADLRDADRSLALTEGFVNGPRLLDARAAAFAAQGDFKQALSIASQAAVQARNRGLGSLASEIEKRVALYSERRPYVQEPYPR